MTLTIEPQPLPLDTSPPLIYNFDVSNLDAPKSGAMDRRNEPTIGISPKLSQGHLQPDA